MCFWVLFDSTVFFCLLNMLTYVVSLYVYVYLYIFVSILLERVKREMRTERGIPAIAIGRVSDRNILAVKVN